MTERKQTTFKRTTRPQFYSDSGLANPLLQVFNTNLTPLAGHDKFEHSEYGTKVYIDDENLKFR